MRSGSSLHFPVRPDGGQSIRAIHGGESREPKIIHRSPDPEAVLVGSIAPHSNKNLIFTGYVHVAGSIFRSARKFDVLTA